MKYIVQEWDSIKHCWNDDVSRVFDSKEDVITVVIRDWWKVPMLQLLFGDPSDSNKNFKGWWRIVEKPIIDPHKQSLYGKH